MKAVWAIIATLFALIGLTSYLIFSSNKKEAMQTVHLLQPYQAKIENIEYCGGKGVCYETTVSYMVNGERKKSRVVGKLGEIGETKTIWTKPNYYKAYESRASFMYLSTKAWFIPLLYPGGVVVSLLLAVLSYLTESKKKPLSPTK